MTIPTTDDLQHLALLHGIQPSWQDVFGDENQVPAASLAALLRALNVDASAPETRREAIQRRELDEWQTATPPVIAIEADQDEWRLLLRVPSGVKRVAWTLTGDDIRADGTIELEAFPASEERLVAGVRICEYWPTIELALPAGYHRLRLPDLDTEVLVIAAPRRATVVPVAAGMQGLWGPAIQLYALRSESNWGIGDYSDLLSAVVIWAKLGAGVVGLNPLHAMFSAEPDHASPYSPSSRRWLNTIYLGVTAIEGFGECTAASEHVASTSFQDRLGAAREQQLVDYRVVSTLKLEVLKLLHRSFRDSASTSTERAAEFERFKVKGGDSLRGHATFEALDAHFHTLGANGHGWPAWPEPFRDPGSPEVRVWCEQNAEQIDFYQYLQWQSETQLARVQERCKTLGMPIGLYLDMAVSVDPAGSDTWTHDELFARAVGIGAPPDEFNPKGQGWGLAPLRPDRLRASQHRFFVETIRAVMRFAGAVRIDHVMGLMRLFWVPEGHDASEGAYVHLPFDELLAIVTLESMRQGTVVVGEDLGTVDPDVQQALADRGVLSYRLVYFERKADGSFKPSHEYPAQALAAISTHDLPTLAGWWAGRDLEIRRELRLFPNESLYRKQMQDRSLDRARLVETLRHAGLLTDEHARALKPLGESPPSAELVASVHAMLGATPSQLAMVQLEDLLGVLEQTNLPGTTTEHPNWRRKLPLELNSIDTDHPIAQRLEALQRQRSFGAP